MGICKVIKLPIILILSSILTVAVLLTVFSNAVREGVQMGLMLCGELVIPSLFVFLCFCEWVSISGVSLKATVLLKPLFRLLMRRYYKGGVALILCLLGGYPMGASALAVLGSQNQLTQREVNRLSLWIFCPSPAFVITGVGQGMLGSLRAGLILWTACVLSCLITGVVLCRMPTKVHEPLTPSQPIPLVDRKESFVTAISSATNKLIQICGMVVCVAGVMGCLTALPLPALIQNSFYLFAEVTNGSSYLATHGGSLYQMGAVLMFGGVCTHLQCKMLLGRQFPSYLSYFTVRIIQTALCYGLLALFCHLFPQAVPTFSTGTQPIPNAFSLLPSIGLLGTCCVFLCSIHQMPFFRSDNREKSRICS